MPSPHRPLPSLSLHLKPPLLIVVLRPRAPSFLLSSPAQPSMSIPYTILVPPVPFFPAPPPLLLSTPSFLDLECKMVQEVQHKKDADYDPRQFEHGDFIPTRRHARQAAGGAFERGAEGGEGFAL